MPSRSSEIVEAVKTLANLGGYETDLLSNNYTMAAAAYAAAVKHVNKEKPMNGPEIKELLKKSLDVIRKNYEENVRIENSKKKRLKTV